MKNSKRVKLSDGSVFVYYDAVDVEYSRKAIELPYNKLRKLVAVGGVKFSTTPRRIDLEIVLDEIDDLKAAYELVMEG